jgi:hypothetical protein
MNATSNPSEAFSDSTINSKVAFLDDNMIIYAIGQGAMVEEEEEEDTSVHEGNCMPHSPGYSLLQLQGMRDEVTVLPPQPIVTRLVTASKPYSQDMDTDGERESDDDRDREVQGATINSEVITSSSSSSSSDSSLSEKELHTLTLIVLANMCDEVKRSNESKYNLNDGSQSHTTLMKQASQGKSAHTTGRQLSEHASREPTVNQVAERERES